MPDGSIQTRWLDREAAASYLSLRVDELPKLVKAGKIPTPSYHLGPKTPRWDRIKLDETFGGHNGPANRSHDVDAAIADLAANFPPSRRKGRQQAAR